MISILGVVGEIERDKIRKRWLKNIQLAKLKGVYKGRVSGSGEGVTAFLSKKGNKEALAYLKKGFKAVEVAKITGLHLNTITKIKKLGLERVEKQ